MFVYESESETESDKKGTRFVRYLTLPLNHNNCLTPLIEKKKRKTKRKTKRKRKRKRKRKMPTLQQQQFRRVWLPHPVLRKNPNKVNDNIVMIVNDDLLL